MNTPLLIDTARAMVADDKGLLAMDESHPSGRRGEYSSAMERTRLASREIPSSRHYEDGDLRVIFVVQTFASLVAESFDQIRGSAEGNVAIMFRMLGALQTIASRTGSPSRRLVLREQVEGIAELAQRTIESPHDRARFESRLAQVRKALETAPRSTHERPTKP